MAPTPTDPPPQLWGDLNYQSMMELLLDRKPVVEVLTTLMQHCPSHHEAELRLRELGGWKVITSEGTQYSSVAPPEPERCGGCTREFHIDNQLLGSLTLWGPPAEPEPLQLWTRMIERLLQCHYYEEWHRTYAALVEESVDAIITIDRQGIVTQFNPGATRMFGYQPEEVVGKKINLLMPPPYAVEHDEYLDRYHQGTPAKIIGIGRRVPARRKDGSIFPAHLAVTQFERQGQRFYMGTMRDISEFIEARSRASVEERRHLSRELHDSVSQALFGIVLGAQAVSNALDKPEQAREAINYVLSLAESGLAEMRTLIFELRPESLESQGLIACLRQQIQALSKRYRLDIELDAPENEPALALPTKHEIYRLLMESLHNVVKHAQATQCRVSLSMEPGECVLAVEDNGRGFEPAKVSPHRMGLASMRERAAQLGGQLRVETEVAQGTRVYGRFPAIDPGQERSRKPD